MNPLAWLSPERIALCLLAGIVGAIVVEAYIAWEARQPWRIERDDDYIETSLFGYRKDERL